MLGGFTTNVIWCAVLSTRKNSWREYTSTACAPGSIAEQTFAQTAAEAGSDAVASAALPEQKASLLVNYILSAVAGLTWYFQFFFYTMDSSQMGKYDFSSWTLHMASIIIFSTL